MNSVAIKPFPISQKFIKKIHISQKYMSLTYKRNNQRVIIVKSTWFRQKVAKTI